jgi:hypothetical protein
MPSNESYRSGWDRIYKKKEEKPKKEEEPKEPEVVQKGSHFDIAKDEFLRMIRKYDLPEPEIIEAHSLDVEDTIFAGHVRFRVTPATDPIEHAKYAFAWWLCELHATHTCGGLDKTICTKVAKIIAGWL